MKIMLKSGGMYLLFLPIVATMAACIHLESGPHRHNRRAYIDSAGYYAAQARMERITTEDSDSLISQALRSPGRVAGGGKQPDIFQSIEDSYLRYRRIFFIDKNNPAPEVRCNYDLVETFRLKVFDPQPFMNAILHTFSLPDVTTLDFTTRQHAPDTLLLRVFWTRAESARNDSSFSVIEGAMDLYVTTHSVSLASPLPDELMPLPNKKQR